MTKTLAMAALLAATAFTPALAQEERRERPERAERSERAERPQWNGNRGGERREQPQAAPQAAQQTAPAAQPTGQRNWGGGNGMRAEGQVRVQPTDQQRSEWQQRRAQGQGGGGWQRQAPANEVTTQAPAPQQRWQGNRSDSWRNRTNDGVQAQPRPDGQRWNGSNGWNGQQRNDSWRNNTNRNDGRPNGWNGNNGRNDAWRNNGGNRGGVDLRAQYQNQYRGWNRNWSNDWRRDRRYDWQGYRNYNRDLFRAQRYYAPYGWNSGYQRFGIGFTLSYLLFDQQYWIDDPYEYRLPPAYGPYRWVRYYDDVLLVDLRSGRVVDAIHNFFYDDDY